jgi:hypothetical protein
MSYVLKNKINVAIEPIVENKTTFDKERLIG